jgi:DNA-binding response OmpR family regulator
MPVQNASRTGRILVVDDERFIVRLLQANLTRHGHTVTTAFDGRDALDQIQSGEFDLVILDVMMPFMDGYEVLKHLRRDPRTAELPVIMLTAKTADEDVYNAYHVGAHAFLTKPVDMGELMTFVRSMLAAA